MSQDLLNLKDYTIPELILFGGGCYLWVIVYIIYVRNIMKGRCIDMPVFAGCCNIGWEFVWAWIGKPTDMGLILIWAYRLWFLLDMYIFYGLVRYGMHQVQEQGLKKYYAVACSAFFLFFGLFFAFYKLQGLDTPIGANSAYMAQMFISVLYVVLIIKQPKGVMFSYPIAWMKMIGTGVNTIFMFMHYPDNHFLLTMAGTSLIIDCIYIYIFLQKRKANINWNWDNAAGVGEPRKPVLKPA